MRSAGPDGSRTSKVELQKVEGRVPEGRYLSTEMVERGWPPADYYGELGLHDSRASCAKVKKQSARWRGGRKIISMYIDRVNRKTAAYPSTYQDSSSKYILQLTTRILQVSNKISHPTSHISDEGRRELTRWPIVFPSNPLRRSDPPRSRAREYAEANRFPPQGHHQPSKSNRKTAAFQSRSAPLEDPPPNSSIPPSRVDQGRL